MNKELVNALPEGPWPLRSPALPPEVASLTKVTAEKTKVRVLSHSPDCSEAFSCTQQQTRRAEPGKMSMFTSV